MINKKVALILLSSVLFGGCTLTDSFRSGNAAKDDSTETSLAIMSPAPSASDQELSAMPSTSTSNEVTSLEADINSTTILEEDFSDLEWALSFRPLRDTIDLNRV